MNLIVKFLPLLPFAVIGCNSDNVENIHVENELLERQQLINGVEKAMWRKGEVRFFDFEGGFYGLIAENGDKLLPMNLHKDFRQHGAIIEFQGHLIKDMMTIQQWGQVFEITQVKLIKAGRSTHHPES